jgi:hypothetical protein
MLAQESPASVGHWRSPKWSEAAIKNRPVSRIQESRTDSKVIAPLEPLLQSVSKLKLLPYRKFLLSGGPLAPRLPAGNSFIGERGRRPLVPSTEVAAAAEAAIAPAGHLRCLRQIGLFRPSDGRREDTSWHDSQNVAPGVSPIPFLNAALGIRRLKGGV